MNRHLTSILSTTLLTLGALVSGGADAAPTAPEPPPPDSGECTAEALARDVDPELDTVLHCDGQRLHGGKGQTDWVVFAHWENGRWAGYEKHGTSPLSGYPCFHLPQAWADGAPAEILGDMLPCE